MLIGIPREPNPEQTLVAGTPDSVKKLINAVAFTFPDR